MALKDIIGHDKPVRILLRTIQRDRLPSSYLFAGESGIGKKFTAINLAKVLNCEAGPLDACEECSACRKIAAGVHPDFLVISPEGSQIRIDEIRAIGHMLSLKAFEGRKKVIIINDADTMNQNASNAFLKNLEEPPEDSLIILISSNPDLLLDTIRSRCFRINFAPLSSEACRMVIESVRDQHLKADILSLLVQHVMGRPGLAIGGDLIEERKWFMSLLKKMLASEKDGWASREEMETWFEFLAILLRDIAILKITRDTKNLINIDLKDYIKQASSSIDIQVIIEQYEKLNALRRYFNFNLNKSLTWNYTGSLLRKTMDMLYA